MIPIVALRLVLALSSSLPFGLPEEQVVVPKGFTLELPSEKSSAYTFYEASPEYPNLLWCSPVNSESYGLIFQQELGAKSSWASFLDVSSAPGDTVEDFGVQAWLGLATDWSGFECRLGATWVDAGELASLEREESIGFFFTASFQF